MAVIYVRISQDESGEGAGVARQLAECKKLAEDLGLFVTKVYKENDKSATKGVRPEFEALLQSKPDVILTWAQDRLLRRTKDLERVIELGVNIHTVQAGGLDLTTPAARAVARTVAAWSQYEVEHKASRQRSKNNQLVESGRPVPGKARYGYMFADKKVGRRMNEKVDESEAKIVRELYAALIEGRSIYGMAQDLNERGVPKKEKKNAGEKQRKVTPWQAVRIRDMLANPAYYGCVVRHGEAIKSAHVEPIVSEEIWMAANAILRDPTRQTTPGPARRHLLSGLILCGTCGAKMRYTNKGYYCFTPKAGHPVIKGEIAEKRVLEQMELAFLTGPPAMFRQEEEIDLIEPMRELEKVNNDMLKTMDREDEGLITTAQSVQRLRDLRKRYNALETKIDQLRLQQSSLSVMASLAVNIMPTSRRASLDDGADPVKARKDIRKAFEELDLEQKRNVVQGLMDLTLQRGRGSERLQVVHKIATGLNLEPDFYGGEY
ncbi:MULTISPECIES: recombinase family protein [unclassified Leucobacter]|uniref:recombinase family protein n=1 Tax=unclassified Leucobacter TaxID=2621730 RepID=UPI00165E2E67|nr:MULTISPECIES: recombinase family protein [unclassified Leucobacter]MBC9935506.1 recombinase family protein [Leucobacter sp. cx-87]